MKISALIPTYNRRQFVVRAINSILSQSTPVDEIIVVDDGSSDGTADDVKTRFADKVRIVCQENSGVTAARRRAVKEASGEWVAFLDSDDEWTADRNAILRRAISMVPSDVAWIFGDSQWITDDGPADTQYERFHFQIHEDVHIFSDALAPQYPWQLGPLPSSVIRRDALVSLNCFAGELRDSEDRLTGIQFGCNFGIAAVPQVVSKLYRTSDLASTSLVHARDGLANLDQQADYFRAGMEAFSLAASKVGSKPWGELYAGAVRGLCKVMAKKGESSRNLALSQFRYACSFKSLAFCCAAMFGCRGIECYGAAIPRFRRAFGKSA
jgi:glycosyltransferase involved in cell wall biosynthesis